MDILHWHTRVKYWAIYLERNLRSRKLRIWPYYTVRARSGHYVVLAVGFITSVLWIWRIESQVKYCAIYLQLNIRSRNQWIWTYYILRAGAGQYVVLTVGFSYKYLVDILSWHTREKYLAIYLHRNIWSRILRIWPYYIVRARAGQYVKVVKLTQ